MATAYICPMCVFNCDNLPDLEQHLEIHEKNGNSSPMKTPKALLNKAARSSPVLAKPQPVLNLQQENSSPPLNRSSPNKTYDRRYSCKSCPFSTHSVKTYFNHRQIAHGEQIAVTECPYCDYASQYPGKVKKHLTDEHPTEEAKINEEKSINEENVWASASKLTDCPFCSFTSMDPEEFRQHILTNHLNDKNFRCLICNRLYRYRGDCSFHIRKKHSDRMVGDNVESLREFISEFHPNLMTAKELKELLSGSSMPSNGTTPTASRTSTTTNSTPTQYNPSHSFRCGYCKFSSANSGDVKKHQTWKHANLPSNILPIDPNDLQQQPMSGQKRKRVQSSKIGGQNEEDEPVIRRQRISMPIDSTGKDLLSPTESTENSTLKSNPSLSAISSLSSRVYKCLRCECLAPHRWIIERHIRAKHPSETDQMSSIIFEIDKPSNSTTNGEPLTATKSQSTTNVEQGADVPAVKAFSCSACSMQSYHLWVIIRHIRNVHSDDGSNAKIIDNINNQIIEDNEEIVSPTSTNSNENSSPTMNNEEMLKQLINTAIATRKNNATNALFENLPTSMINNTMAASLATLFGQLTNKPIPTEKSPTVKRYKCSLCTHVSAWGGNVKKHLKRMHPGEHDGHVIDLGLDGTTTTMNLPSNNSMSMKNDSDDESFHRMSIGNEKSTKLKDIDNALTSMNNSQSTLPERLYGCSVCTFETTDPSEIHQHVEFHGGDDGGGYQCSQCFFLSKWRASIRKHMMSSHGSSLASLSNVLEPLIVLKSSDASIFVKKWILHEQENKHEDDPNNNHTHSIDASNYYCSSCPYSNSNRLLFEQHLVHHNPSKNQINSYTCTFCTYQIDDKDALEDHRMLHRINEELQQSLEANARENEIVS